MSVGPSRPTWASDPRERCIFVVFFLLDFLSSLPPPRFFIVFNIYEGTSCLLVIMSLPREYPGYPELCSPSTHTLLPQRVANLRSSPVGATGTCAGSADRKRQFKQDLQNSINLDCPLGQIQEQVFLWLIVL